MNTISEIWNFIVTSNFFNFVVMVLILTWIINKVNLADILEKAVVNIKTTIEKAEQEKSAGEKELQTALKSVENLDNEIKERINTAEKHAEKIAQNIITETEQKVKNIESNIERAVTAEEKTISARLSKKAASASAELAKQHIKAVLESNPSLHEKYINQSIEELG